MSEGNARARAAEVVRRLRAVYPEAACALEWGGADGWKLMVLARLSAQCSDRRVNLVSGALFRRFPTPAALAAADPGALEEIIRPCGLFRTKAESIRQACAILARDYGGVVPDDEAALLALPGVGRKSANLLLGELYRRPGIVADTHCIRICGRLGFYPESVRDPVRTERIMGDLIEPAEQIAFCHRIVRFGRDTCAARGPACRGCPLLDLCPRGIAEAERAARTERGGGRP